MNNLTAYDYGFRIYNPAIGKFLSEDPLTKSYPELTPYQFASNNPIEGIDLDGLEYVSSKNAMVSALVDYNPMIGRITEVSVYLKYGNFNSVSRKKLYSEFGTPGGDWTKCEFLSIDFGSVVFRPISATDVLSKVVPDASLGEQLQKSEEDVAGIKYTSSTTYNASNKFKNDVTKSFGTEGVKVNNIVFSGQARVDKASGYLAIVTLGFELLANILSADEFTSARNQRSLVVGTIASKLNKWLENIPNEYKNNQNLTSIANYLLYGEIPITTTASGNKETNNKLLEISKKIWDEIAAENKAAKEKKELEKREKYMTQNPTDNTSNKTL